MISYIPWSPQVSFFCSWNAMDDWLRRAGVSPQSLRCRNHPIDAWDANAPNCYYTAGDQDFLLLRPAGVVFDPPPYINPTAVRAAARRAVWRDGDPFAAGERFVLQPWSPPAIRAVTQHASVRGYEINASVIPGVRSRVVWFVPAAPVHNRFAIYHEGHGGAAVEIAADMIDWLLERGWQVIAMDMPLTGLNAGDVRPNLTFHNDFARFDDGRTSPLAAFLLPVKAVVDAISDQERTARPDILMIGRSGGGWTTYTYAAMDPRIDWAVPVAGGRPVSQRLDAPWGAAELGDYEQTAPHLYDEVAHSALLTTAGSRGGLIVFNEYDPCCFRVSPDDPFIDYVAQTAARNGTIHRVFVDRENPYHSLGPRGLDRLDAFLADVLAVPAAPVGTVDIEQATVVLRWEHGGGASPSSYRLEVGSAPGHADLVLVDVGATVTSLNVSDPPPGTYYVRVRGATAAGLSAPSPELVVTVGACPAPGAVPDRPRVGIHGAVARVAWSEPAAGCPATGYLIEIGSASGLRDLAMVPVGSVTTVWSAIPPPGVYYLRVRATSRGGISAASGELRVTIY